MNNPFDRKPKPFRPAVSSAPVPKALLLLNVVLSLVYFAAVAFFFTHGNAILFWVFLAGEVFHLWQIFTFVFTMWGRNGVEPAFDPSYAPSVDVFITVTGEPTEIVEETVRAALAMDYPNHKVYILNDGFVAKKDNWREAAALAERYEISCITRKIPGGAKAGNINNALKKSNSELVVVFDADHIPHQDFLKKMTGYFVDSKMGFVQSPQFYKNHDTNYITSAAWEQQELFFGPILKGKQRNGAAFMCGTNMLIRRRALIESGGMREDNIAEDFLTSLFMHRKGWKSVYVPEVLAEGLAPEDFLSYYKQQLRWARGSLEVIFKFNPVFMRGLSWRQKIEYLASSSYYLSGAVVLMNALLPLAFFYTGAVVFPISTMAIAAVFLPYIFLNLYILQTSSNFSYTFRALSFSMSSFWIQLSALWAVLTGQKTSFAVTSKQQLSGNFLKLATPHLVYTALVVIGVAIAIAREGVTASVMTNTAWALLNVGVFVPFILAASPLAPRVKAKSPVTAKAQMINQGVE